MPRRTRAPKVDEHDWPHEPTLDHGSWDHILGNMLFLAILAWDDEVVQVAYLRMVSAMKSSARE